MWGISSAGRALAWHARGQRFDPAILHQKSTVLRRKYGAFLFYSCKRIRGAPLAMQAGQCHPRSQSKPLSDLAHAVFSAPPAPCQGPPAYLYVGGLFLARVDYASRAAKNSPPGCFCPFFCDGAAAVRIHPHENSNFLQTENRQRISTLTVFLWARVDCASRASKKAPQGLFSPPDCSAGRCCSNPPA